MVRFIMITLNNDNYYLKKFTFQYGQIYYPFPTDSISNSQYIYIPIWLDLLFKLRTKLQKWLGIIYIPIWLDLLSTNATTFTHEITTFTFQYGQIYYLNYLCSQYSLSSIYIPIWLDLLS